MEASSLEVEDIGEKKISASSAEVENSIKMMSALPTYFVLQSKFNEKYLRYIYDDAKTETYLQFSGEEFLSSYGKFAMVKAKNGKGFHILCCWNNKYWVRQSEKSVRIVAGADRIEENTSKWSCTLFKPVYVDGDTKTIKFLHVQLGDYASLWRVPPPHDLCLYVGSVSREPDLHDVCTIIDWDSLFILPKHVVFRGDNGYFLSAQWLQDYPHLQFSSSDINDPRVVNEVFPTADGSVYIKSNYFEKFWAPLPDWVLGKVDDSTSLNCYSLFWPAKVNSNALALLCLGNNKYCRRVTTRGWVEDCLRADLSTILEETHKVVIDLTLSREIYNSNFHLLEASIYDQKVLVMATGDAVNKTQAPNTVELMLHYTETRSTTWDAIASFKSGVKTIATIGIPSLTLGQVKVPAEFSGEHKWGDVKEEKTEVDTVYIVTVPPMTRVKVSLLATQATCRVPFSYTQRDTLRNRTYDTYNMDDGIYTSTHCFDFKYETEEEELCIM